MQPCSREMQAMNSLLNPTQQIPLQDLQINGNSNGHQQIHTPQLFDPTSSHDYFFEQMLSTTSLPSCSWSDLKSPRDPPKSDGTGPPNLDNAAGFHYDAILASKLRQHQINDRGGNSFSATAAMKMMMLAGRPTAAAGGGGIIDGSLFKSTNDQGGEGSLQALCNQSLNQPQHFHHPQANFGATAATEMNQSQGSGSTAGAAAPAQPKQKVRARRGQATDPHSIAERLRRVRIAERMKALQELVPNANKTEKTSMLDEIIDYVKFLQLQVKVLSMSRLGAAAAVAPLVTDMPSEGGGDCIQTSANGGSLPRNSYSNRTSSANDSLTVTEHQVAKLMEEDMGSAMQYLQGKGLCLMPISLATTISTVTSHSRNPMINNANPNNGGNGNNLLLQSSVEGPSSPSLSVLTVQSATMGNVGVDGSITNAASFSKP